MTSTLEGKNILIIGAREGGYGASMARAMLQAGASVYCTTLNPKDPREVAFFETLGATLLPVALRYGFEYRPQVWEALGKIEEWLRDHKVPRLDAVIHAVAGGFPRQPSVMKAVADILKGNQTFSDLATLVKRNVYYVNAGSFDDTIEGLNRLTDANTLFVALTYRGNLPYFIAATKQYLERIALRHARKGRTTLLLALPEAWTQSSQFFTGIELAVIHNYLMELKDVADVSEDVKPIFMMMEQKLSRLEGLPAILDTVRENIHDLWPDPTSLPHSQRLHRAVQELFGKLRSDGRFSILRQAVEIISEFVREASAIIVVRDFVARGQYESGDVRQLRYRDLTGLTRIGLAAPREGISSGRHRRRNWKVYEKEEIQNTLSMYGPNFLFLDRVVMEAGEVYDGLIGFGSYTVPTPEENPILRDHFVGMPLFGGHLQMEAVAQFGTFMVLKLLKDKKLVPILTGTEFPDLNTMAPPGEKLTMMGIIHLPEKRNLSLEAFIENRFARSKGVVRGMVLNERLVKKIMLSFKLEDGEI